MGEQAEAIGTGAPHDERMFPRLAAGQVARLAAVGRERRLADGEVLWEEGATDVPLFVVQEGAVEIRTGATEQVVVVHEPGGFTGDVDLLSDRGAVVWARARGATRLLEIERRALRALVKTDAELGEVLLRAFILRRVALISRGLASVVVVGARRGPGILQLLEFLTRNGRPHTYVDVERDPSVAGLLERFHLDAADLPVVICGGDVVRRPTVEGLAECMGLAELGEDGVRDLVVVGAGPSGLAAAVYAASEGLDVLVLESYAPGGQAGASSRIENYLGFPTGISGNDLAARAFVQAEKFGARVAVARTALRLDCSEHPYRVSVDGRVVRTRTIVVATGARYRKAECPDIARFEGSGVYFAATALEARLCEREEVIVVGGGNSAGQAVLYLARSAARVHLLVRGPGLAASMSEYLIGRIRETPNVALRTGTEIEHVEGGAQLERVTWVEKQSGRRTAVDVRHVFLMTGASPNTGWLEGCVLLDAKGFVRTGADLAPAELRAAGWPLPRAPLPLETSRPGVFAVGDVRAGSVKRVAAAVGEGSACVASVHRALAEERAAAST